MKFLTAEESEFLIDQQVDCLIDSFLNCIENPDQSYLLDSIVVFDILSTLQVKSLNHDLICLRSVLRIVREDMVLHDLSFSTTRSKNYSYDMFSPGNTCDLIFKRLHRRIVEKCFLTTDYKCLSFDVRSLNSDMEVSFGVY